MEPNKETTVVPVHGSEVPYGENGWPDRMKFPIGYRFLPSDEELITDYLMKKVLDQPLPANIVKELDLYNYSPQELEVQYGVRREKEMYFFTRTKLKYTNGSRPSRQAPSGFWRASTSRNPIRGHNGQMIGHKLMLVYHKTDKKQKTDWLMYEYTIPSNSKKEEYVLCKIYNKGSKQVLQISAQLEETRQNLELRGQPIHTANLHQKNLEPQIPQIDPNCLQHQNIIYQNVQLQNHQNMEPLVPRVNFYCLQQQDHACQITQNQDYQNQDLQLDNELFTIKEYAEMGIDVTIMECVPEDQNQNQL